jgi:hypothetical protein
MMYMDANLPNGPRVQARRPLIAPGAIHWRTQARDRLHARFLFKPHDRIQVDLWMDRPWHAHPGGAAPDVQLIVGLYGGTVEFGSLTGNGFDNPSLQHAGFGTFAVNLAVEALQYLFDAHTLVEGALSNTDEDRLPEPERERLAAGRRAFWRRFGLQVVRHGDSLQEYLHGTVGGLRRVSTGLVAGQFPRCVSLACFGTAPDAAEAMLPAPVVQLSGFSSVGSAQ